MSEETRTRLLEGALRCLVESGLAKTSARGVAAAAGVNQALIFYHFGSVEELLAAACRHGARQRVESYRGELEAAATLGELLEVGRRVHARERAAGTVGALAQLLAAAQANPRLAQASAAGLELWAEELEAVLERVLAPTPVAGLVDVGGLARALAAGFVGLELYEGADAEGAERALGALEQLGAMAEALNELGPVAQRAVRSRLRRAARGA
ncbi:TetR/AcrR family transcriptional regulator [Streptomonospora sp. S1-112]|uniref:TetR/AcrR family transcriptional regulator n=1 Tax=Streptomonospora mangrovi TaxID=2883123 RepID=A0A9X3SFW5_9ACTN|nr:TetR/AcrR family transcriptional regulator [Streptomonospora mangrovi]MDA0563414.1 TetR/AcrR family transcriptional regulator [Streptomonospora mangrovi]